MVPKPEQTFTRSEVKYHIRDWTRDGAVCRYKSFNHGHWKYVFFTEGSLEAVDNIKRPQKYEVSAADVRRLRDLTSAGLIDCKKAMQYCNGDIELAKEFIRLKGTSVFQNFIRKNGIKLI